LPFHLKERHFWKELFNYDVKILEFFVKTSKPPSGYEPNEVHNFGVWRGVCVWLVGLCNNNFWCHLENLYFFVSCEWQCKINFAAVLEAPTISQSYPKNHNIEDCVIYTTKLFLLHGSNIWLIKCVSIIHVLKLKPIFFAVKNKRNK